MDASCSSITATPTNSCAATITADLHYEQEVRSAGYCLSSSGTEQYTEHCGVEAVTPVLGHWFIFLSEKLVILRFLWVHPDPWYLKGYEDYRWSKRATKHSGPKSVLSKKLEILIHNDNLLLTEHKIMQACQLSVVHIHEKETH